MINQIENKALLEKWDFLLSDSMLPAIKDTERKIVTARLLENTCQALDAGVIENVAHPLQEAAPTTNTAGVQNYDPVLISMIRRAAPKLIAYDIVGVQPLSGPTGQIFAMRSRYSNQTGPEAFFNEANTGFSTIRAGNTQVVGDANLNLGTVPTGNAETYNFAGGMTLAQAEALGTSGNAAFREMSVSIEKILVEAKSRALKAEYTQEFAQDLKAIHGLDAHKELANVLSTELVSEINREIVRTVYLTAVTGSPSTRVTTAGTIDLDTDTNGRWMGERFEGLVFHTQLESNDLAKATRRGKGNIMLCSSNVASALTMAKVLDTSPAANLQIDDTGNTFAGVMNGIRVYIDPYATSDYIVLGYKGQSSWDAGIFYCPYTPLQMTRALDDQSMTPKIGFKTRYGVVANPMSKGLTASNGTLEMNANVFYRRSVIANLM
ncbi:major capsid protein [Rhizobium phage RHph_I1_18]|nr:major capsid protein [Rhizobium phage RHph_I1_18]